MEHQKWLASAWRMPLIGNRGDRNHTASRRSRFGRARDLLLYVVIAVMIVVTASMFGIHQARTGGSPKLPMKWIGFASVTALVFGYAIKACRRYWRRQRFWLFLGLFLIVHLSAGMFVLLRLTDVPLILYAGLAPIEFMVLAAYLGRFLDVTSSSKPRTANPARRRDVV